MTVTSLLTVTDTKQLRIKSAYDSLRFYNQFLLIILIFDYV